MTSLNPDWLDALAIVRREVGDIQPIFNLVETIDWNNLHHQLVHIDWRNEKLHVSLRANMPQLTAKIERLEVMTYLAAGIKYNKGDIFVHQGRIIPFWFNLCRRLGCCPTNTADIRERWRLLDFETPLHLLPSAPFEDRPRCSLCHSPVATGAGAYVRAGRDLVGPLLATGSEVDWWFALPDEQKDYQRTTGVYINYKDNVHEECMRFAHRVLVPARRIQQAAEKLKVAGEVDK